MLHEGPVSQLPSAPLPPDLMEIVVMLEDETVDLADFAALVYGKSDPVARAWSAWLLLEEGIYFSGSIAVGIKARPVAEITAATKDNSRRERGLTLRSAVESMARSISALLRK